MGSPERARAEPATTRSAIARTPSGAIEYRTAGTGFPVLVLHGSPGGIDQAELMARFLPADLQAIVVSRPGYLGTPLGACRAIDDEARLLAALLDHLGVQRASILAWSGGGPAAYRLAVLHPDRVASLVMIAAVSKALPVPKPQLATRLLLGTGTGEKLVRVLAEHQPRQVVQATLRSEGSLSRQQLRRRVEEIMADSTKRQFVLDLASTVGHRGARRAGHRHDLRQAAHISSLELDRIRQPCLLVHGSADTDVPPDHSTTAAAAIPNADLLTLETGTHLAFYTHPNAAQAQARAIDVARGA